MFFFHKTEIHFCGTYLIYLNLDWFKSYDIKCKYSYSIFAFLYKNTQLLFFENLHFCILCHNLCTNYYLDSLSTLKWLSEHQFCERWAYSMQKNGQYGCKMAIYYLLFLQVSQAGTRPLATLLFNQSRFRPVKHLNMTAWFSVLWEMNIKLAKNCPKPLKYWNT